MTHCDFGASKLEIKRLVNCGGGNTETLRSMRTLSQCVQCSSAASVILASGESSQPSQFTVRPRKGRRR